MFSEVIKGLLLLNKKGYGGKIGKLVLDLALNPEGLIFPVRRKFWKRNLKKDFLKNSELNLINYSQ